MIDPIAPLRVVATNDPALDLESMGDSLAEYAKTRDASLLKFKTGMQPAWFLVRGMTAVYLIDVVSTARTVRAQSALAFLACVHEVELPDGRKLAPEKIDVANRQRVAADEWLDVAIRRFGIDAVQEIGRVAVRRAELPEDSRGPFV
jgi:hypothetical protein